MATDIIQSCLCNEICCPFHPYPSTLPPCPAPHKNKLKGFRELLGLWTHQSLGREMHSLPMCLAPCISSMWLFLSCIPYRKLVIVSKVLSWVLWAVSSKLSNPRRGWWESLMCTWLVRSRRDQDLWLASEVGSSLVRQSPYSVWSVLTPSS